MSDKVKSDPYIYIVCAVGWQYDDNNYFRSDDGGTHPQESFFLEKLAQERCDDKNFEWCVSNLKPNSYDNIMRYTDSYDLEDVLDDILKKLNIDYLKFEDYNLHIIDNSKIKQKDILSLMHELNVMMYEVVKVKLVC